MLLEKTITAVLFDLDGTLLPMDLETFTNAYFGLLAKKAAEYGYSDGKALVAAVWAGTKAMVKNDGSKSNCDRFWEVFAQEMGEAILELRPVFDEFYSREFHGAKAATGENPLARQAVRGLKQKGCDVILATNPLFPAAGVETRLSWIGLKPEDFSEVTSYETYSSCKPNPAYFREILGKTGKRPEECLMVGNDADEDLAAMEAGIDCYLVTDCLINKRGRDLGKIQKGTFQELMELFEIGGDFL